MTPDLSCPVCGTELSMATLLADADAQQAFARLAAVSIPLGARVMAYLTLFSPPKTRLTVAKQVKLVLQLLPDLERQAITSKGRDWAVPHQAWAQGIDQVLGSRHRLDLPLKGHGYLFAILVGLADKQEAQQERNTEAERRGRSHQGGLMPAADVALFTNFAAAPPPPVQQPQVMTAPPPGYDKPSSLALRIRAENAARRAAQDGGPADGGTA